MGEKWVDLNYGDVRKNYYEISNYGRIRLKNSKRILKTFISNTGYERIGLATDTIGKKRNYSVHRLVAETLCLLNLKVRIMLITKMVIE